MSLKPIVETVIDLVPQKVREKEIRLVYLGTATYDKDDAFQTQTKGYSELPNCRITKLDVSEAVNEIPTESEIRKTIHKSRHTSFW